MSETTMSTPVCTTLRAIHEHAPCAEGWAELLSHLGKTDADDEPLPLTVILDSNGLDDAIWALRAVDGHKKEMRLFAVWCARQVQHVMKDPRSIAALDIAERYAHGNATDAELAEARALVHAAAFAALAALPAHALARAAAFAALAARAAQAAEFRRVFGGAA